MALVIAIMVLAIMGTAAMARAGLNRNDTPAQPTPQVLLNNGKAVIPVPSPTPVLLASTRHVTTTGQSTTQAPLLVVASPTALDQAWSAEDWPQVLIILNEMLKQKPGNAELIQKQLTAHYNYGVQLVRSERLSDAIDEFDRALAINASDTNVLNEKKYASLYLTGSSFLSKADFASAIPPLRQIVDGNSGYRSAKSRLYQAYIGYADQLEKEGKKSDAYTYFLKASKVDTQAQEAQAGMTRLNSFSAAVVLGKKIEVDLSKQQVIVYDNNKVLYRFKASTGKAPGNTRTGDFEILNKMDKRLFQRHELGHALLDGYLSGGWLGKRLPRHGPARQRHSALDVGAGTAGDQWLHHVERWRRPHTIQLGCRRAHPVWIH